MWTKKGVATLTTGPDLVYGNSTINSFSTNTGWYYASAIVTWPSSGSLNLGIRKIGDADTILCACPVLVPFGSDVIALTASQFSITPTSHIYKGTAPPTAGTWVHGDIMLNTTPSAGGTPGWVCTTAGTPGTWKAMANVAP
jgi:hypothetical protein